VSWMGSAAGSTLWPERSGTLDDAIPLRPPMKLHRQRLVLCLSKIKSEHIRGAIRRGLGGKECALPSSRCAIGARPYPRPSACASHYSVAVSDHVARSHVPRKRLGDLTCNPLRRRVGCDVNPSEISTIQPHDDERIKQIEANGRDNEQVLGGNVRRVVMREGPPSLPGRPPRLTVYLAMLDCAISSPSLSSSPWIRGAPQS
jgi:hypothetical protein